LDLLLQLRPCLGAGEGGGRGRSGRGRMSKEQARAGALERLQRASAQHRKQLESVEQLEQDGTFSKDEADAERLRIGNERSAAKAAYQASLQRIEAGEIEAELALLAADERRAGKAPKRPRADRDEQHTRDGGAAVPQAQGQALRDLRVQQLQRRAEEAARALKAATEGDPELVAFEQRLEQLAAEEKKKGPTKHFTSLAWRKSCVAMIEIFHFGVLKSARKMAALLDEEGVPSSWEKQFASLKNWRRAFAAGKLGPKEALLDDEVVNCGEERRAVRLMCAHGARPGPRRMFHELERLVPAPSSRAPARAGGLVLHGK